MIPTSSALVLAGFVEVEWEAVEEGDGFTLPQRFRQVVKLAGVDVEPLTRQLN
jgi:hypothetical protein